MKPLSDCKLYTFVDTAYLHGRSPEVVARELCEGGSDIIQLRAKESSASEIRTMAENILPITTQAGVRLIINDYPEIAFDLAATGEQQSALIGFHLGQEDFFDAGHSHVSEIRKSSAIVVGLSSHAPEQAARAVSAGADYVAIGPVYATGTKPGAKPVTLEYVRWAAANVKIPWFAIGGINLETLGDVMAAGARRVCVVSGILNASDIAAECKKYKDRLA